MLPSLLATGRHLAAAIPRPPEGFALSYADEGAEASALSIVLVPALEGSREIWRAQRAALRPRHRVLSYDLPRRRPWPGRTVGDYAEDVRMLLDLRGVARAVVMGVSFGSTIALEVAARWPGRVRGLVLVSPTDRPRAVPLGANRFTVATAAALGALAPGVPRAVARRVLRWAGRHHGYFLDGAEGSGALVEHALDHGLDDGLLALADRAIAGIKVRHAEAAARLAVPALLVRGAEDRLSSEVGFEALATLIPRAEALVVPATGHCPLVTRPDAVNAAILDWLARLARLEEA